MNINPTAVAIWLLGTACGFLYGEDTYSTVAGFAIALAITIVVTILPDPKPRKRRW